MDKCVLCGLWMGLLWGLTAMEGAMANRATADEIPSLTAMCASDEAKRSGEAQRESLRHRIMALVFSGRWDDAELDAQGFRLVPSTTGGKRERGEELLIRAYVLSRRGQDAEALAMAERAESFFAAVGDREGSIRSLEVSVRASQGLGDWIGVRKRLDRLKALAETGGSPYGSAVEALNEGVWAYHQGKLDEALDFWDRAFVLSERIDNPEIRGLAANHVARGKFLLGLKNDAAQWFQKALERAAGIPWLEFVVRLNRAEFLAEGIYDAQGALADLDRAETLAASLDLEAGRLWVWNNQTAFHFARGEYGRAEALVDKALRWQMSRDVPEDVGVFMNGANLRLVLGDESGAEKMLRRALELAQQRGDRRSIPGILTNLGIVAKNLGYLEEAESHYRKAVASFKAMGMERDAEDVLINVANLRIAAGNWNEARKILDDALERSRARGDRMGEALVRGNRGYAALAAGAIGGAMEDFEKSLGLARDIEHDPLIFFSLWGLAQGWVASGDRNHPLPLLEEAAEVLEQARSELASVANRMAFMERRYEVYDLLVDLYVRHGRFQDAFAAAERMKARAFLDVVEGGVELRPRDRELVDAVKVQEGEVERLSRRKSELLSAAEPVPEILERRLVALKEKLAFLRSDLSLNSPELLSLVAVNPLTLEEIQRRIPEGTTVVDYYLLADRVVVFLISRGSFSCRELPLLSRSGINQAVEEVVGALKNAASPIPYVPLSRLFVGLVEPLAPELRSADCVVVVPQGMLSYVPFQTFWDGECFLVDRLTMSYAPSASVYALLSERQALPPQRLLGLGNPHFVDPAVSPLPFAEEEARQVASLFPQARLLLGAEATESAFLAQGSEADVLHLATHAMADPRRPLNSLILLTPDGANDGNLTAGEVFGMTLSTDCVVLSACETALGHLSHQEGLVGFSRSFFHAGASALFVSLWSVADEATAQLFVTFFQKWLQGEKKASALQKAQQEIRRRAPHPKYWAPFILVGKER